MNSISCPLFTTLTARVTAFPTLSVRATVPVKPPFSIGHEPARIGGGHIGAESCQPPAGCIGVGPAKRASIARRGEVLCLARHHGSAVRLHEFDGAAVTIDGECEMRHIDRKSTRLNSSHLVIS